MPHLRRIGWVLLFLLLTTLALAAAVLLHLSTQSGRNALRDIINAAASDALVGELHIDAIDKFSMEGIAARGVQVLDGAGHEVIAADEVRATFAPYDFGPRLVSISQASVSHGRVTLRDDAEGLPTLLQALSPAAPDSPSTWLMDKLARISPLGAAISGVSLHDIEVRGELLGLRGIAGQVDRGTLDIDVSDEVDVRLKGLQGTLSEPFGFTASIDALDGSLSSRAAAIVDLNVSATRDDQQAAARVVFGAPDPTRPDNDELTLVVQAKRLGIDTVTALGFDFLSPISSDLRGTLTLQGPPQELQLSGTVETDGGEVQVEGSLGEPVQVTAKTAALSLAKAFDGLPEVTVAGAVTFVSSAGEDGVAVSAALEPSRAGGFLLPSFDLSGSLLPEVFVLERLSSRTKGSRVSGSGEIPFSGPISLSVTAHYDDIARDQNLHKLVPNLAGAIDAKLDIRVPEMSPVRFDIRGTVEAHRLRYGALSAEHVEARGRVRGEAARPHVSVDVLADGTSIAGYPFGQGTVSVDGGPREYAVNGAFVRAGSRHFAIDGTLSALSHELLLRAKSLEVLVGHESFRGTLDGLHLMDDESIRVDGLLLVSRSQRLEAKGAVSRSGTETFTAQLQDFDMSAIAALAGPQFPLREGRADAALQVTGDVNQPKLQLQGALRDGTAFDLKSIQALYLATYENGNVELDGEVDLGDIGLVRLSGVGKVPSEGQTVEEALLAAEYDLELEAEDLDLGQLPQLQGRLDSGVLNGEFTLRGSLVAPDVKGTVTLSSLCLGDESVMTLASKLSYLGSALHVELSANDQGGPLGSAIVDASVPPDSLKQIQERGLLWPSEFDVNGTLAERASESWPKMVRESLPIPIVAGGSYSLRRSGGALVAEAHLEASPGGSTMEACPEAEPARLVLDARATEGTVTYDARVLVGKSVAANASGSALLTLDDVLEQRMPQLSRVSFESKVQLKTLQSVPGLCGLGTGDLEGALVVRNALSPYPTFRGELSSAFSPHGVQQTDRHQTEIRSCNSDPARLKIAFNGHNESAFVTGTLGGCGGQDARISGHFPVHWTEEMWAPAWREDQELSVSVRFKDTQLRALLDRIPGVQTGEAIANGVLRVSGRPEDLEYWGEVDLAEGRLRIIATGQTIEDVRAKIVFAQHRATLEHFEARADEGLLELKGQFSFQGILPDHAQLALTLSEFPIRREGIKLAWFTGSAALESDIDAARSRTAIVVRQLSVRLPNRTPGSLQALESHADVTLVSGQTGVKAAAKPYALEFQLKSEQPIKVSRDDFEATVLSELAVSYEDPRVRVGGYLEFRRGRFEVFGKEFKLVQGGLRFDGSSDMDPEVNLVANHTVPTSQAQVVVTVRGHLSSPDIRFSSETCEGQAGALALLVAGRCTDDPDSPTQSADTESAFATGLLSGVLTLGARRELGGLIPNLAVESGRRGYATRVRAGVEAESVIPAFMRPFIRKVYLQGAVSAARTETDAEYANQDASLDFLLLLYFPHNIVGSGHFAVGSWGLDVTWEP